MQPAPPAGVPPVPAVATPVAPALSPAPGVVASAMQAPYPYWTTPSAAQHWHPAMMTQHQGAPVIHPHHPSFAHPPPGPHAMPAAALGSTHIIPGPVPNDDAKAAVQVLDPNSTDQKQQIPRKPRKPYTATKTREMWSAEEHARMIEGLHKFQRDWAKVTDFVGTRSTAQVRSHAQKYFDRVARDKADDWIPRPRPKRRSTAPYPRKASITTPSSATALQHAAPQSSAITPTSLSASHTAGPGAASQHGVAVSTLPSGPAPVSFDSNSDAQQDALHRDSHHHLSHLHAATSEPPSGTESQAAQAVTPHLGSNPPTGLPSQHPVWYPVGSPHHDPRMQSPSFHQYQHCIPHPSSTPNVYMSPYFMSSPISYDPSLGTPPIGNALSRSRCHHPVGFPAALTSMPHVGANMSPHLVNLPFYPSSNHPPHPMYGVGMFSPVSQMSYAGQDSPASNQYCQSYAPVAPHVMYNHMQYQVRICPHGNGGDCPKCAALHRYGNVLQELHHLPRGERSDAIVNENSRKSPIVGQNSDNDSSGTDVGTRKVHETTVHLKSDINEVQRASSKDSDAESASGSPQAPRYNSESHIFSARKSQSFRQSTSNRSKNADAAAELHEVSIQEVNINADHAAVMVSTPVSSRSKSDKSLKTSKLGDRKNSGDITNGRRKVDRSKLSDKCERKSERSTRPRKRARRVLVDSDKDCSDDNKKRSRVAGSFRLSPTRRPVVACDERKEMYDAVHTLQILASAPTTPAGSQDEDS